MVKLSKDVIGKVKEKNLLKNIKENSIIEVFDGNNKDAQVEIASNKNSGRILDRDLSNKVANLEISEEQASDIWSKFSETQQIVNSIKPLGLEVSDQAFTVDLIKEKRNRTSRRSTFN